MTTGSGSPALIIWTTASLVSTSWASEVVPGSEEADGGHQGQHEYDTHHLRSLLGDVHGRAPPGPSRRSWRSGHKRRVLRKPGQYVADVRPGPGATPRATWPGARPSR